MKKNYIVIIAILLIVVCVLTGCGYESQAMPEKEFYETYFAPGGDLNYKTVYQSLKFDPSTNVNSLTDSNSVMAFASERFWLETAHIRATELLVKDPSFKGYSTAIYNDDWCICVIALPGAYEEYTAAQSGEKKAISDLAEREGYCQKIINELDKFGFDCTFIYIQYSDFNYSLKAPEAYKLSYNIVE